MVQLAALGVQPPQINALGAYQQGQQHVLGMQQARQGMEQSAEAHQSNMQTAQVNRQTAKQAQALQAVQTIGAIAIGSMGGNLNGKADPQKFEQGLDILEGYGVDVAAYRGKPELAPVVARSSLTAMQQLQAAQSDREYEMAVQKFEMDVRKAMQGPGAESPLGKLAQDFRNGLITKEQYDAAVSKATAGSNGITIGPDGTVTIGGNQSAAFMKEADKNDAATIKEARDAAANAQELRSIADQMTVVIPKLGVTGPILGGAYGAVDDVIGILPGEKGARGAFRQMSMEAQLAMTQKTKGAITDREMAMFKQAVPGLTQTEDGNKAMVEIMKATAQRLEERASFFEKYRATHATLNGATEAWGKYLQENPLISTEGGNVRLVAPKKTPDDYLGKAPTNARVEITTKEQYDALPSGSEFIWKGNPGKKP